MIYKADYCINGCGSSVDMNKLAQEKKCWKATRNTLESK